MSSLLSISNARIWWEKMVRTQLSHHGRIRSVHEKFGNQANQQLSTEGEDVDKMLRC